MADLAPVAILETLGYPGPARATPVGGGADTAIWRVERGGEVFALRVFRAEQVAVAGREVAAMRAAAAGGVPVPIVHAAGSWQGRPVLLLSWMPGRPLMTALMTDPSWSRALGVKIGRAQAAIHAVPPPVAWREHPFPWPAWARPDDALLACLRAVEPRPDALLHLDYHPLNVLVEDGRLTAVLDWANARPDDPRFDLARTVSILRLAPVEPDLPPAVARRALRALETGWRRGYEERAGPIGDLAPFYAWAGAAMARDLAPRVGRPDLPWLTSGYLGRVRRWAGYWRTRAGCQE